MKSELQFNHGPSAVAGVEYSANMLPRARVPHHDSVRTPDHNSQLPFDYSEEEMRAALGIMARRSAEQQNLSGISVHRSDPVALKTLKTHLDNATMLRESLQHELGSTPEAADNRMIQTELKDVEADIRELQRQIGAHQATSTARPLETEQGDPRIMQQVMAAKRAQRESDLSYMSPTEVAMLRAKEDVEMQRRSHTSDMQMLVAQHEQEMIALRQGMQAEIATEMTRRGSVQDTLTDVRASTLE